MSVSPKAVGPCCKAVLDARVLHGTLDGRERGVGTIVLIVATRFAKGGLAGTSPATGQPASFEFAGQLGDHIKSGRVGRLSERLR